jgi:prepilin-type N-terminal cleavage/methylation domain-containing protein
MSRLRREDGFTLPELLVTLFIALVVSMAALSLLEFTMKRSAEVDQRVDASQRGRLYMDTITRELRSQVCLDGNTPSMATRTGDPTDGNDATFYADMTEDTTAQLAVKPGADLHRLTYDPATKRITDYTYKSTWDKSVSPPVAAVPATPTSSRVIATDVIPKPGTPIFAYYAFDPKTNPPTPTLSLPLPPTAAGGALLASDVALVARIDINFIVLPVHGKNNATTASTLQDQVFVRAADPNNPAPTPICA